MKKIKENELQKSNNQTQRTLSLLTQTAPLNKGAKNRGITLVALVVTIIVLIILASVTLNIVLDQDGIISKAQQAVRDYENAQLNEQQQLADVKNYLNEQIGGSNNNNNNNDDDDTSLTDTVPVGIEMTNVTVAENSIAINVELSNVTETDYPITINYYKKLASESETEYECIETKTITEGTTDSYTYSDLDNNTSYSIKIEAIDASENENYATVDKTTTCFVAGTKVLTENGLKNIEEIQVGEKVYSINLESNQKELKEVKAVFERMSYEIYEITIEEKKIETTPLHKFYVENKGWIEAYKLQEGDRILSKGNSDSKIIKIERKFYENQIPVYNFEVEDNHNYLITEYELLVHNAEYGSARTRWYGDLGLTRMERISFLNSIKNLLFYINKDIITSK